MASGSIVTLEGSHSASATSGDGDWLHPTATHTTSAVAMSRIGGAVGAGRIFVVRLMTAHDPRRLGARMMPHLSQGRRVHAQVGRCLSVTR